jgi:tetratricopeptide (TPR) repeat protein
MKAGISGRMVAGFVLGLVGALGLGFVLGRLGAHTSAAPEVARPTRAHPRAPRTGERPVLRTELERLRKPVEEARETRAPVESHGVPPAAANAAAAPRPVDILAELAQVWNVAEPDDTRTLVRLLVRLHLDNGDPRAAFSVLERHGATSIGLYDRVARDLLAWGDRATAGEAFSRALAMCPGDTQIASGLIAIDAFKAIDVLESALASGAYVVHDPRTSPTVMIGLLPHSGHQMYQERPHAKTSLVKALRAAGRTGEARALLESLLDRRGNSNSQQLGILRQMDPDAAEVRLREWIADPEDGLRWVDNLADLLEEKGRGDEAADLLEAYLRAELTDDDRERLCYSLISSAPRRAFEYLEATLPADAVGGEAEDYWGSVADELLYRGDVERAADGWCRAIQATRGDPQQWVDALLEHAPQRALIPLLEKRVAGAPNAAFWSSLADAYWRDGRREEALTAWSNAGALDPSDDEWSTKLDRAAAGVDPLDGGL